MNRWRNIIARVLLATMLLAIAVPDAMADDVFAFSSEPGDPVGNGTSGRFTSADATFSIEQLLLPHNGAERVIVYVSPKDGSDGWALWMETRPGQRFFPGRFDDAMSPQSPAGRVPALSIEKNNGLNCWNGEYNVVYGGFGVRQVDRDVDGKIIALEVEFLQRCDRPNAPRLSGTLRYRAEPLSVAFDGYGSESAPIRERFYNDTGFIVLSGTTTEEVMVKVAGKKQEWTITLAPPAGQMLREGTFRDVRVGLEQDNWGYPQKGCLKGFVGPATVNIRKLEQDAFHYVTKLFATFEVQCRGAPGPFIGTIRFFQ